MTASNKRSEQGAQKKKVSKKKSKKKAKKKVIVKKKKAQKKAKFIPKDEAEKIKGSAFTLKEELYCFAYVGEARGNKRKAAGIAGYQKTTSASSIYAIHRFSHILKRIEILTKEIVDELRMSSEDVEAEWGAISRFDIRNLVDEHGNVLNIEDLDTATARAISSIKIRKEIETTGKVKRHVANIIEVKANDKNSALSNVARSLGMFKDVVIIDPSEVMTKLLEKLDGSSLGPPAFRSGKDKTN